MVFRAALQVNPRVGEMDNDIKGIDGSLGPGYNLLAGYFYYGGS